MNDPLNDPIPTLRLVRAHEEAPPAPPRDHLSELAIARAEAMDDGVRDWRTDARRTYWAAAG